MHAYSYPKQAQSGYYNSCKFHRIIKVHFLIIKYVASPTPPPLTTSQSAGFHDPRWRPHWNRQRRFFHLWVQQFFFSLSCCPVILLGRFKANKVILLPKCSLVGGVVLHSDSVPCREKAISSSLVFCM